MDTVRIELNKADLELLASALDSHVYWQLSDECYRNDGAVNEPGSDDPEAADEIQQVYAMVSRVEAAQMELDDLSVDLTKPVRLESTPDGTRNPLVCGLVACADPTHRAVEPEPVSCRPSIRSES